jgi:murein DD-endopeptidase MepM/ murein hydrolase activator NlpD
MHRFKNVNFNIYHILCFVVFIHSCATQPYAPIEFKGHRLRHHTLKYYNHTIPSEIKSQALDVGSLKFIPAKQSSSNNLDTNFVQKNQQKPQPVDIQLKQLFKNPTNKKQLNVDSSKNTRANLIHNISQKKPTFILPVQGFMTQKFNTTDQGIIISARLSTPVKSIQDGQVVYAGYDDKFGNLIIIKLNDSNLFVAFAHLKDLIVSKGQKLAQGQIIGYVGYTGQANAAQLYIAIKQGKQAVDPLIYLKY